MKQEQEEEKKEGGWNKIKQSASGQASDVLDALSMTEDERQKYFVE